MELEGYSWPMCNELVHSVMMCSTVIGVIHKLAVDKSVDAQIHMTCCGDIFKSPKCTSYTCDPNHAHSRDSSHHRVGQKNRTVLTVDNF